MKQDNTPQSGLDARSVDGDLLGRLLEIGTAGFDNIASSSNAVAGIVIGTLLAMTDNGETPLVTFPGQAGLEALRARSIVDLDGRHLGRSVVLMFERGDATRPVVMGALRGQAGWPADVTPASVDVDADGERMMISAKEQLVLRCGQASITLTRDGKVSIRGATIVSQADGSHRIRGGSVELN